MANRYLFHNGLNSYISQRFILSLSHSGMMQEVKNQLKELKDVKIDFNQLRDARNPFKKVQIDIFE